MSTSTNLGFPYLAGGQAQKHVTVNESLLLLDALVQLSAISATTTAQPGSPSDGAVYFLPSGKTGADWGGMTNGSLAYYRDGAWEEIAPREGWIAYVKDVDYALAYSGSAWTPLLLTHDNEFTGANIFSGAFSIRTSNDGSGTGPTIDFDRISASPAANDGLARFRFLGRDSAAAQTTYAYIGGRIVDPTDGSEDGAIEMQTVVAGTLALRFTFGAGLYASGATGGDKGAGTINATAIYDDNVLLTCGPVELMREGGVDLEKWDALAANQDDSRKHEAMHHFANMMSDGFDPRDPSNCCARMRSDGAVPGLFTEAEWQSLQARGEKPDIGTATTRIFLALDNLAVAFDASMQRIAALEARLPA